MVGVYKYWYDTITISAEIWDDTQIRQEGADMRILSLFASATETVAALGCLDAQPVGNQEGVEETECEVAWMMIGESVIVFTYASFVRNLFILPLKKAYF